MGNVYVWRQITAFALREMAQQAHPHNRSHQARWIRAIRFMRSRPGGSIWLLDSKAEKVSQ